jgi:NADPH-dependent 2,4-dienoyl-CoA reductase/sulfur reductase-like enzyme
MNVIRTMSKGVSAKGEPVTIRFGSRTIETMAGQSVLGAMVAAGEMVCRTTATGAQRGMFCGMGVCQDCVVDIDGVGNQRACMTQVRDGMIVNPLPARPQSVSGIAASETLQLSPELLVVGGGPAGLAAAAVAAEAGLDVLLLDERPKLGGQFYKQPAEGFAIDEHNVDKQFRGGRALIRRFVNSGARYFSNMTVWGAFGTEQIVASSQTTVVVVAPKRIVLATGAYERGIPLPGWTLPGFMTTGAMQTLLRSYQVAAGKRILIGGNGPLNLQVAAELVQAGVKVVALTEAASQPGLRSAASLLTMAISSPDLVRDGLAYQSVLRHAGTPTFHRHAVIRAEGTSAVERGVIAAIDDSGKPIRGTEQTFEVDAICVGFGFLPSNEIARALGCHHHFDEDRRSLAAERNDSGRSSLAHVWVVGDSGGLGGARIAEASGVIAGADIAQDLGHRASDKIEVGHSKRTIVRSKKFQSALWTLYKAPQIVDQLAEPDTIVCRCENITLAAVREALTQDPATAGAVKRLTRAGMGPCQGRYCGAIIVDLVAQERKTKIEELSFFAPRVPFKPVPIAMMPECSPKEESPINSETATPDQSSNSEQRSGVRTKTA